MLPPVYVSCTRPFTTRERLIGGLTFCGAPTESLISVAHMTRCAIESQGGGGLKFEKNNSMAHKPGAPQKVDILWRTKLGTPQNLFFKSK